MSALDMIRKLFGREKPVVVPAPRYSIVETRAHAEAPVRLGVYDSETALVAPIGSANIETAEWLLAVIETSVEPERFLWVSTAGMYAVRGVTS